MSALLEVEGLRKHFLIRKGILSRVTENVRAVEDISFTINRGETVGLVGESGSGKSTVARLILRLVEPTAGIVRFEGRDLTNLPPNELRALRRRMQIVFQDPFASLNPRMNIGRIVGEGLDIHKLAAGAERAGIVARLLEQVGLPADAVSRYPHEFSGGQRQRIGIARALAAGPSLLIADEPVAALDVSVQAQVLNLLQDLQEQLQLTILFISHDLSVVEVIADRVIVMYLGRIMEIAPSRALYRSPRHPYTRALLSAIPDATPGSVRDRIVLKGDLPSPLSPPSGCVFRTRCPYAIEACAETVPPLVEVGSEHMKACIRDDL